MTTDQHKQDHELVQASLAGDKEASEQLVRQALDRVRRVLYRVLGPDPEFEDSVQETMYQILKSLPRFRGDASWMTWVTRVTVNQARQFIRKRRRHPAPTSLEAADALSGHEPGPEKTALDAELRKALYEVMDKLDVDKRVAVSLYELAGLSMAEVAEATGVTRSTAKSRVWFGRKYLLEAAARHPALAEWLEGRQGSSKEPVGHENDSKGRTDSNENPERERDDTARGPDQARGRNREA